jgi:predicted dehydrogenase
MSDSIGVGMLGYAFMGKAHSNAYKTLAYMTWPPPLVPELVAIAGRDEEAVADAARRYGFAEHVTDWHALISDERVQLFDNSGPNNLHAEPTIAAAEAGKHVICEKPLGRDAAESYETWQRVAASGVKHMCAFNYRFVPAVRLARQII